MDYVDCLWIIHYIPDFDLNLSEKSKTHLDPLHFHNPKNKCYKVLNSNFQLRFITQRYLRFYFPASTNLTMKLQHMY